MCCADLLINLFSLNKLHSVIILCRTTFTLSRGVLKTLNNPKEKYHWWISETIRYYYVDLKLFLQKFGLALHELPITYGKGPHPGPIINAEINFHGFNFEITLSSKVRPRHLKSLNKFVH